MFDIFPNLLSSAASFLFPVFASYKALKTSDPAQLTPWLMFWVVSNSVLFVESWTYWIIGWFPFYAYLRLFFFIYLISPQTQGARYLYEEYFHPLLQENEPEIEEFIATAHEKLKAAGLAYMKLAIEYIRTTVFGLPPAPPSPRQSAATSSSGGGQTAHGYTQSLLARFVRPVGSGPAGSNPAGDFYSFLAGAVSAATGMNQVSGQAQAQDQTQTPTAGAGPLGSIIPDTVRSAGASASMSFIQAQREKLNAVMNALEMEEQAAKRAAEGGGMGPRSPSGESVASTSGISLKSEPDFVKLDKVDAAAEEVRRRAGAAGAGAAGGQWWG